MERTSLSLKLPTAIDQKSNKILLFDCLLLLGDELGAYYDEKMQPAAGEAWLRTLAQQRNDHGLTLNDPDFVIKEPLKSDSPLRSILPKSPSFYKNLDILRRIRNHIAHNKVEGGYEQTREILGILLAVSMDINLTICVNEYASAIKRVEALERGLTFDEGPSVGNRVEEIEDKNAEIEELLFEEKEKSAKVAELLEEARSVVVIKEIELAALSISEIAKTKAAKEMEAELIKARLEADKLKEQLEANTRRAELLKKSENDLKSLVASLAYSQPEYSKSANESSETDKENSDDIAEVQEAGTPWNLPKGSNKIVLSVSSRDLVDSKSGSFLKGADPTRTKALAELWLKIRPQGGRIFIDSEGHASTLIDDRLIYLGNAIDLLG